MALDHRGRAAGRGVARVDRVLKDPDSLGGAARVGGRIGNCAVRIPHALLGRDRRSGVWRRVRLFPIGDELSSRSSCSERGCRGFCFRFSSSFGGLPAAKSYLNRISSPRFPGKYLHQVVVRTPPVVPVPTPEKPTKPEDAVFLLNWLSATGTGVLASAIVAGLVMGFSFGEMLKSYGAALYRVRFSLLTIAAMLAIGHVTRYSGTDVALAKTGGLYPLFGTILGWLGVALTGPDTAECSVRRTSADHRRANRP